MAPPLVQLRSIALTFGGTPLFSDANLTIQEGERIGLIGRNGSGKSTFLKILSGEVQPDHGECFVQPGTTIRTLAQEPDLSRYATIRAYALDALEGTDDPFQVDYLLEALKVDGSRPPDNLSGGEKRRAALARTLAPKPDILLLDEPTNHLDIEAIEWLESEILQSSLSLVLISHDRAFLKKLTNHTVWIDRGITHKIPQGFDQFEEWRDQFFEKEEKSVHKMKQKIAMEEDWLRYGVTARRKRNQKRLGALLDLRQEYSTRKTAAKRDELALSANAAETSGKLVLEVENLNKSFADKVIIRDFNLKISRGERIAILGPNGAGKTTLIKLLIGEIAPDGGTIRQGTNLQTATLDQQRTSLHPETTLKDAITMGSGDSVTIGGETRHIMSYLKDFLFRPEQAGTPISALSGGERGRVMLARALTVPSNLMILDEPTNDLDLETLDILQEMLSNYDGTLILVSHDRDFIDRIATSTIVHEGNGDWRTYVGGYSDYLAIKKKNRPKSDKPKAGISRTPQTARSSAPAKKLTFKEEHLLKTLPDEIEKYERDIAKLLDALSDPQLYQRDRQRYEKYSKALSERQEKLELMETRWLELESLRENLKDS